MRGPKTAPTAQAIELTPTAIPLSEAGKDAKISGIPVASIAEAPSPWMNLNTMSSSMFCEMPHSADDIPKAANPMR